MPVAIEAWPVGAALGKVLAETIRSPRAFPAARQARRDGWAVASHETIGATPYAPVPTSTPLIAIRAGEAMPEGRDAVLPPHALDDGAILQAIAPGADTREPGGDVPDGGMILEAGLRLRADHCAVLASCHIETVPLRVPRLAIEGAGAVAAMLDALAIAEGTRRAANEPADMTLLIRDPGYAGTTPAAQALACDGTLIGHGLALRPGEAVGVGSLTGDAGRRHIIVIVPDRLDDAMAAWLLLVKPGLTALAGLRAEPLTLTLPLTRKIVSAPGLADLVLLRRNDGRWDPIATGDLPWSAFLRAEAWGLLPAESEGAPAGAPLRGFLL